MDGFLNILDRNRGYSLTLVRVVVGLIFFQHGYGKIVVSGFTAVGAQFDRMGFVIPQVIGPFIGLLELVGGAALVLGLLTRYLGLAFTVEMLVAAYWQAVVFHKGLGGAELEFLLAACAFLLASSGAGMLNLGYLLKKGN